MDIIRKAKENGWTVDECMEMVRFSIPADMDGFCEGKIVLFASKENMRHDLIEIFGNKTDRKLLREWVVKQWEAWKVLPDDSPYSSFTAAFEEIRKNLYYFEDKLIALELALNES